MEEKKRKTLYTKANQIIKRILEQALPEDAIESVSNDYSWIKEEIQKEGSNSLKRELLSYLLKKLSSWYEKQYRKRESSHLSVIYVHMIYFLYCLQMDKSVIPYSEDGERIKIRMSYEIIESLRMEILPEETRKIISYLISKGDIEIFLIWEEYKHITNKEISKTEEEVERFFRVSKTNIEGMEEYEKSKQAYLVMQSLLK